MRGIVPATSYVAVPPVVALARTVTVALQPVNVSVSTFALTVSLAPPVLVVFAARVEPVHSMLASGLLRTYEPSVWALIVDPEATIPCRSEVRSPRRLPAGQPQDPR